MSETAEHRLKKLRIRSNHRGTKEMDLVLGPFADSRLAALSPSDLDDFEALLSENDQDLYQWVSGQCNIPAQYDVIIGRIRRYHCI